MIEPYPLPASAANPINNKPIEDIFNISVSIPQSFTAALYPNLVYVLAVQTKLAEQPSSIYDAACIKYFTEILDKSCKNIQKIFEKFGLTVRAWNEIPYFSGELRNGEPFEILIESESLEPLPTWLSEKLDNMAVAFQDAKNELHAVRVHTNHIPRSRDASEALRKGFAALKQACTL